MNPVASLGGYVLSRDDLDPDPTVADKEEKKWSNVHQLPFGAAFYVWLGNNWQVSSFIPIFHKRVRRRMRRRCCCFSAH